MNMKLKTCFGCGHPRVIWKCQGRDRLCRECYGKSITGVAKKPKPTAQRIPTRSSKKSKKDVLYSVMRIKFLTDHPMCHAHIDARCTKVSTEVHHKAGRIEEFYLDTTFWLPTCHNCHCWIELHSNEAKALGLSVSRLSIETNQENEKT